MNDQQLTLTMLIERVQSKDEDIRAAARDNAGPVGASAVGPLAEIACDGDMEIARAANQALQNVVYYAGRPGAADESKRVAAELVKLVSSEPPLQFRRDVLWMLWQIAGPEAVPTVAALLSHPDLREDARMCLEGLPTEEAVAALRSGLKSAPEEFQPAVAHSLRRRGVQVPDVPELRLVPTRPTSVTPVGR